eukprot:141980_1
MYYIMSFFLLLFFGIQYGAGIMFHYIIPMGKEINKNIQASLFIPYELVDYFLEHSLHNNTSELSQLHEAYSEHNEKGILHKDCLTIAKYHSFALDFAKTGVAAVFPHHINIPMNKEIRKLGHCIYPHYMSTKPFKQKFHSKMIKGRIFDFVLHNVPNDLMDDRKFRKDCGLPDNDQLLSDHWFLRGDKYNQQQYNNNHNDNNYDNNNNNNNNNNNYNNNNNNNRQRHENIDNDYHWLDG